LLRSRFPPFLPSDKGAGRLDHVESCESEAGKDAIEEFWQKAIESRSEGLMIKVTQCLGSDRLIGITNILPSC
jgi:DNA ligase-1